MPLQWRNQIWQSLEEGAGKRCSECDAYPYIPNEHAHGSSHTRVHPCTNYTTPTATTTNNNITLVITTHLIIIIISIIIITHLLVVFPNGEQSESCPKERANYPFRNGREATQTPRRTT